MTYSYVEYGVIIDRTNIGLGKYLAATYRDFKTAKSCAESYPDFPASVQMRFVQCSEWEDVDE